MTAEASAQTQSCDFMRPRAWCEHPARIKAYETTRAAVGQIAGRPSVDRHALAVVAQIAKVTRSTAVDLVAATVSAGAALDALRGARLRLATEWHAFARHAGVVRGASWTREDLTTGVSRLAALQPLIGATLRSARARAALAVIAGLTCGAHAAVGHATAAITHVTAGHVCGVQLTLPHLLATGGSPTPHEVPSGQMPHATKPPQPSGA